MTVLHFLDCIDLFFRKMAAKRVSLSVEIFLTSDEWGAMMIVPMLSEP